MHSATLDCSLDDARLLAKGALELVDDIETYREGREGVITAKTGFRLGFLASSYGETLTVTLRAVDETTTEVAVAGEKNVELNVGANPDRYALEFLRTLNTLAEYPLEDAVAVIDERTRDHSKEVHDPGEQADGSSVAAYVAVGIAVFVLLVLLAV